MHTNCESIISRYLPTLMVDDHWMNTIYSYVYKINSKLILIYFLGAIGTCIEALLGALHFQLALSSYQAAAVTTGVRGRSKRPAKLLLIDIYSTTLHQLTPHEYHYAHTVAAFHNHPVYYSALYVEILGLFTGIRKLWYNVMFLFYDVKVN